MFLTTINKKSTMKSNNDYGQFYIIDENVQETMQQVTIEKDNILKSGESIFEMNINSFGLYKVN